MQRLHVIMRRLKSFVRNERAVAAVEFALVVPLMLVLYLGSVEVSRLYTADRKVSTLASTMADLVSRQKDVIELTTLNDYFTAATNVMQPLDLTGLGQVVSLVEIDDDGEATVVWSVPSGNGVAREVDSPFPLEPTDRINILARNAEGYLIAAEASYPYEPMIAYIIKDTINLSHVDYFLPRFEDPIALDEDS